MTITDITEARHPIYLVNAPLWAYYDLSYVGGPLYPSSTNPIWRPMAGYSANSHTSGLDRMVVRHSLEDTGDYLARLYRCPTVNLCQPAVDMLAGTVGAPDSITLEVGPDYQDIIDDADLTGESFTQFMTSARKNAAIHGHVFILVDSTRVGEEPVTEADVQRLGIRPYYRQILPADMLSWRLDRNGKPTEILFRLKVEEPGSILDGAGRNDDEDNFEYRYWSRSEWRVYSSKGGKELVIADQGPNPIGEIPIAVLYHQKVRPFLGQSLLKESAKYQQLLTNWLSDLDQTMVQQSFSQACLRSDHELSQLAIGATKVIQLHPSKKNDAGDVVGEADFFYRAPEAAPIATMWDSFFRLIDMSNSSMSLTPDATVDKSHPESGISRAWRWHSTEKLLITMATHEQECARNLFYFAARWKGQKEFNGQIVYGTHFDLSALEDDISNMLSLQTVGMPAEVQNEMKARLAKKALPNMSPSKQAEIDAAMPRMSSMSTQVNSRLGQDVLNNAG